MAVEISCIAIFYTRVEQTGTAFTLMFTIKCLKKIHLLISFVLPCKIVSY